MDNDTKLDKWIHERIVHVHGEREIEDYKHSLDDDHVNELISYSADSDNSSFVAWVARLREEMIKFEAKEAEEGNSE